jgi:hydrogenase maturation protease
LTSPRRLLIGVGNPDRGDDGAGRVVARRLRGRNGCAFEVCECAGEAIALMEAWTGFDDVVLVDACRGAGAPGSIHRLTPAELLQRPRGEPRRYESTHGFGVAEAIGLARALGRLPSDLVIYAIEAGHSEAGTGLSEDVDRAVRELVALLVQESRARRKI